MLLLMVIMLMQVDTLCDRLAILVAGRVNAEGSPDQLKQHFGGGYKVSTKLLIVDRWSLSQGELEAGRRLQGGGHGRAACQHPGGSTSWAEERLVELQVQSGILMIFWCRHYLRTHTQCGGWDVFSAWCVGNSKKPGKAWGVHHQHDLPRWHLPWGKNLFLDSAQMFIIRVTDDDVRGRL